MTSGAAVQTSISEAQAGKKLAPTNLPPVLNYRNYQEETILHRIITENKIKETKFLN